MCMFLWMCESVSLGECELCGIVYVCMCVLYVHACACMCVYVPCVWLCERELVWGCACVRMYVCK